ncbi:MAG: hypothetical protein AAGB51_04805 [Planctomycetota bacterium]
MPLSSNRIRRPQSRRVLAFEGVNNAQGIALKCYHISRVQEPTERAIYLATLEAALATTDASLAEDTQAGSHHGAGFLCIHFGEHASWLLVSWWVDECILCQRMFRAELGTTSFEAFKTNVIGCTWELAVHCHERAAWARHVLYSDEDEWLDRYLKDVTQGEI